MVVEGRNKNNEKITLNSDEDAPYKLPIPESEKDSISAFREHGKCNLSILLKDKALIQMQDNGEVNGDKEE